MPTPLAHAASGLIVYGAVAALDNGRGASSPDAARDRAVFARLRRDAPKIAVLVAVACAADLDYLFGLPWLAPNRFHQGWTHSAAFAVLLSLGILALRRGRPRGVLGGIPMGAIFAAALLHPLLDWTTEDTSAPYGIPLLWPFSDERFNAAWSLFPHVRKGSPSDLLAWHNVRVLLFEFSLCVPLLFGILWLPGLRSRPLRRRGVA